MTESTRDPGWADHEQEQRRRWLRLTFRQRLDWLWQAKMFALRAAKASRRTRTGEAVPLPRGDEREK
jgi:hypothetical protein